MKRASYLNWSLVRRYLTLSCALVALEGASTGKDAGSEVKQDAKEAVKLVDGIANRNKPPELKARFPQRIGLSVPVFPKSYDWQEDERVIESLKKLWANPSIELWEELVRMDGKDARYCITVKTPGDNAKFLRSERSAQVLLTMGCSMFTGGHSLPIQRMNVREFT